jgi:uncharacterized lipoprotein YmbA
MIRSIFLLLSAFTVFACTNTAPAPTMQYYLLDTASDKSSADALEDAVSIELAYLPDYLNQTSLVMLIDEHKMEVARFHSWADRLADSIARVIEYESHRILLERTTPSRCKACYDLRLSIEHFYPSAQGDVFLSGYYEYTDMKEKTRRVRFSIKDEMLQDGYQEAVKTMRQMLVTLSMQITQEIETHSQADL